MRYFNVSTEIFRQGLTPSELMVYCALASIRNRLSYAVSSVRAISNRTGLSQRTVSRALEGLLSKGLLSLRKRYRWDKSRAANGYWLENLGGRKFKVPAFIWSERLDSRAFSLWLYLVKTMDNRTKEAYPSLNRLEAVLGMSRTTILSKMKALQEQGLVRKSHQLRKCGSFACSRHLMLLDNRGQKKEGRVTARPSKPRPQCVSQHFAIMASMFSLTDNGRHFNGNLKIYSFVIKGVVQFWHNRFNTHLSKQYKRKYLVLSYLHKQKTLLYIFHRGPPERLEIPQTEKKEKFRDHRSLLFELKNSNEEMTL